MKPQTPQAVVRAQRRLGKDMRAWRQLQRLTIEQVADRAGVSRDVVIRLEAGQGVTLETALRVARALGRLESLSGALDPYESDIGRLRADEELPQRIKRSKKDES